MSFWDYALQCDEQARTERLMEEHRTSVRVAARQEEEITALKARAAQLEGHLQIANEARAKAEADLLAERQQKEEAAAALAPVQEQVNAAAAEKAALAGEHERLKSRFDDLTTDLAAARKEVSELETACGLHIKDYNDVAAKNKELADDLQRLQKGIPGLVKLAIASDSVTAPFKEFLTAVQEVEVLQTINLISEHVPDLPTPLPDAIASKVNPDCVERAQRANEALQTLTIPFIERIGSEVLSVNEILGMQP